MIDITGYNNLRMVEYKCDKFKLLQLANNLNTRVIARSLRPDLLMN